MGRIPILALFVTVVITGAAATRLPVPLRGHLEPSSIDGITGRSTGPTRELLASKKKASSTTKKAKKGASDSDGFFISSKGSLAGVLERKVKKSAAGLYGASFIQRKVPKASAKSYSFVGEAKSSGAAGAYRPTMQTSTGSTYTPSTYTDYSGYGVGLPISDIMRIQHETTMSIINNMV